MHGKIDYVETQSERASDVRFISGTNVLLDADQCT
jgi:hypothetical protein